MRSLYIDGRLRTRLGASSGFDAKNVLNVSEDRPWTGTVCWVMDRIVVDECTEDGQCGFAQGGIILLEDGSLCPSGWFRERDLASCCAASGFRFANPATRPEWVHC